ncbi:MAG TPA: hypothetical protein VHO68_11790 [Bacteroidales bacterium]|nr:hypothetical protein [Bacteroidales bacterium]
MNGPEKQMDDFLRKYLEPEKIAKAPEGFTPRVMSRVRMEPARLSERKNNVLLVFAIVFAVFLVAAIFTPGTFFSIPEIRMPEIPLKLTAALSEIHFPQLTLYIVAGLVLLSVFDGVLSRIFGRRKRKEA